MPLISSKPCLFSLSVFACARAFPNVGLSLFLCSPYRANLSRLHISYYSLFCCVYSLLLNRMLPATNPTISHSLSEYSIHSLDFTIYTRHVTQYYSYLISSYRGRDTHVRDTVRKIRPQHQQPRKKFRRILLHHRQGSQDS